MKYYDPNSVQSPKDYIENVTVLFDGGPESFSIAFLEWEGGEAYAIRWNIARREWDDTDKIRETKICVGMPSSHGYPVWFVLPSEFDCFVESLIKKQ